MGRGIHSWGIAAVLSCVLLQCCSSTTATPEPSLDALFASSTKELRQGQLANALALAERGIAATNAQPDSEAAVNFRLLEAEIALFRRDPKSAQALLAQRLPDTRKFDGLRARQQFLGGQLLLVEGRLDEAKSALVGAGQAAAAAGARDVELDAKVLEGQVLLRMRQWDEAEAVLESAVAGAQAARDAYRQAAALHNLGMSRVSRSRFDAALPYFDQILAFKELESYTVHATALTNAAMCEARLGEFDRALATLQRAVRIHEERGSRAYLQQALGEMGHAYLLSGRMDEGIPRLRQAFQVATEANLNSDAALWAGSLASAHISRREWELANEFNAAARRLGADPRNQPYQVLNDAQIAEGRGDLAAARKGYEEASRVGPNDPTVGWLVRAGLGRLDIAEGRWHEGMRNYEAALGIVEQTRVDLSRAEYRLSIQSRLVELYGEYVEALVGRRQFDAALAVADSSRARVLAERHGVKAPARSTPAALQRVAAQLDAVLLFYWLGADRSYVWLVTSDRVRFVALPTSASRLEALAHMYRQSIVASLSDPLTSTGSPGDELYAALIAPVAPWIPHGARVVIVPDGALNTLNFETLTVPGDRRHYWVEDAQIAVAPSLATLSQKSSPSVSSSRSVLLIGDPVPADPKYPSLRYASAEMMAVSSAFADRAAVYRADQATPAQYLASQPGTFGIVHFTAHAEANAESPLDSAVILSRDGSGYKLYARDVADRPLSADLVTISACRSAGERTYAGEGLVGFAWAFLRAGARRVIAGLWDVDDRSTAALMGRVYANVAAGASPGEALRAAKLEMIRSGTATAKPYYWAPFQLFVGAQVVP